VVSNGNPGIRTAVWRQMGTLYGGLAGHLTGQNMDLLIETLDKLVVTPLETINHVLAGQGGYHRLTVEVSEVESRRVAQVLRQAGARWVEY